MAAGAARGMLRARGLPPGRDGTACAASFDPPPKDWGYALPALPGGGTGGGAP